MLCIMRLVEWKSDALSEPSVPTRTYTQFVVSIKLLTEGVMELEMLEVRVEWCEKSVLL